MATIHKALPHKCDDASPNCNAHSTATATRTPHGDGDVRLTIRIQTCVRIGERRPERPALWVVCNMVDGHDGSEDRC